MPRNSQLFEPSANEDWKDITKKALYSTAIGSVGAYLLFGETGRSSFLEVNLPSAVTAGIGCGIGSIAGDFLTDKVVAQLNQSTEIKTAESLAIKLAISAGGTVASLKYGSGIEPSMNGMLLGSGAKFGGDSVHASIDPLKMLF